MTCLLAEMHLIIVADFQVEGPLQCERKLFLVTTHFGCMKMTQHDTGFIYIIDTFYKYIIQIFFCNIKPLLKPSNICPLYSKCIHISCFHCFSSLYVNDRTFEPS